MFFSNNDHSTRPQFYIAANDTNGIDIYARLMTGFSTLAWAPSATGQDVTYYNQRVDALPEDAVQLTDRVNASLSDWSVGSASTPVYFSNGVAQEATDVNSHINDSSIHLPSVLPITRGGTGADDRTEAEYNLLGSIDDSEVTDTSALDNRKIPLVNITVSATNGVFRFLSFSVIWNWIKHKLGISSSGSSTKFLNEQGEWATVTFTDIPSASTSQKGVVQLSDSTASASSETAATSAAVKQAYDLAASKQEAITWMTDAEALLLWTDAWNAAT